MQACSLTLGPVPPLSSIGTRRQTRIATIPRKVRHADQGPVWGWSPAAIV